MIRGPDEEGESAQETEKHWEKRHGEDKARMESKKPREGSNMREDGRIVCIKYRNFALESCHKALCFSLQEFLVPQKDVQRNSRWDSNLGRKES